MLTIFGGLSSPFSYSILHRLWNQVMSVSFSVDDITTLHIYTHSTATTAIIISHTKKNCINVNADIKEMRMNE